MDARNSIANDLFYKVRSRFSGLKLGSETGEITINPEDARFFDFDYKDGEVPIGHVTISLAEPNSMKVYFSSGISESMEHTQKKNWYGFLRELRMFAKRRLMAFDTRDIAKDNLDKRDFQFLTTISQPKASKDTIVKQVGESVMNESQLYGTKTVSYQKLMDTRLIIKHSHALTDDTQPGARSRNISALFVENQDGERFKYPFIHLAGARAMQRHVANGGAPYDDIGKSIVGMSEEIAQLRSFGNYVVRNDLMNSDTNSIVERSSTALNNLREQIAKLSKQHHYAAYKESFQARQPIEVPLDVAEDYTNKFTVRNFKEDLKTVFPILYRLTQEDGNVEYDDIVAMTTENYNDEAEVELEEDRDEFADFEQWVMSLGESSPIQSNEEQLMAIESLNKLTAQAFPAGVDGTNAIESLKGIIDDPKLFKEIKDASKANPEQDIRPLIQAWLQESAPEVAGQIDFGDMEQTAAAAQPAAAVPAVAGTAAPVAAPTESLGEARTSGDYEIDGEMETVHFERDANGTPRVTKVMIGNTDVTAIEDLESIADSIDSEDTSPLEEVYTLLSIDVDADYEPAERGSREGGIQMEPDYPASSDVTGIIAYGNGTKVNLDTEDFPDWIQDKIQDIANEMHSGDDDYDIPDDYYEAVNPQNPRDYERPAVDRKAKGHPPLRMQDVRAKDTEHKRNFQDRVNGSREKMNVKEVAEFIHSFYDKESNTFPKGPEGVVTMVGKKFGEQAAEVARKLVERMAPQQSDPQIAELSRIRELSGMKQSSNVAEDPASRYQANKGYSNPSGKVSPDAEAILKMLAAKGDWRELGRYYEGEVSGNDHQEAAEYIRTLWDEISYDMGSAGEDPDNTGPEIVKALKNTFGNNESVELESIKRLSGIAQGIVGRK